MCSINAPREGAVLGASPGPLWCTGTVQYVAAAMYPFTLSTAAACLSMNWRWLCYLAASWQHLHSAASHQLTLLPHRRVTYGGQVFTVTGPLTWNSHQNVYATLLTVLLFLDIFSKRSLLRVLMYSAHYSLCRGCAINRSTFYITLHLARQQIAYLYDISIYA